MADVKIIDIDNEQWNMKDQEARNRIANLEELGNILDWEELKDCNVGNTEIFGNEHTLPKGTWLVILHQDMTYPVNTWVMMGLEAGNNIHPRRVNIIYNDINGGFAECMAFVVSDGTTKVKSFAYYYGSPSGNNKMLNTFSAIKLHN